MTSDPAPPTPFNPYQAPAAAHVPGMSDGLLHHASNGAFLYVRNGAVLPEICPVSGQPVDSQGYRKTRTLSWTPPWIFILFLVNLLVMLIVALIVQKKAKVLLSLSPEVRKNTAKKRWIGTGLAISGITCIAMAISSQDDALIGAWGLGSILLILFSLLAFIASNPLKVVKHRDGWLKIKGCSPGFLAQLPSHPAPF
ncbi:hypothetical protein HNR46_003281 [Haloferula luteola]|uniref:Uncharacterized protein n=1 Tax=Haloferula luteola TaxID=595692 RepID=A0A840VEG0_9BACT|nr:hypothetical protein [Haloferula luteola]MBB5353028.1 hypothetical protein [Haloferula luteola]